VFEEVLIGRMIFEEIINRRLVLLDIIIRTVMFQGKTRIIILSMQSRK